MTISTTGNNRDSYTTNGSTTAFAVTFPFLQVTGSTHALKVIKVTVADGTEVELTENSDYTVSQSGGDPSTGTVTISPALASGFKIYILPNITVDQQVDLENSTTIDMPTIEKAFDKLTLINQSQDERLTRAVILSETSDNTGIEFPAVSATNSEKIIRINAAGTELEAKSIGDLVSIASFDISSLSASTTLSGGTDHLPFYDVSGSSQNKATISDVVEAGLIGATSIDPADQTTIKTNLGIESGGGTYAQVAYEQITSSTQWSLTSGTSPINWQDIGFSLAITPGSSSNLIELAGTITYSHTMAATNNTVFWRILRDGVAVLKGDTDGSRTSITMATEPLNDGTGIIADNMSFSFIDSPATTSEVTYTIEVASVHASGNFRLNGSTQASDHALRCRTISNLTAREITV